jgi:hypothetical protein
MRRMRRALSTLPLIAGVAIGAPARADDLGRDLVALARTSVRPAECGGAAGAAGRWERARESRLGPYCDLLARGYSLLANNPRDAIDIARKADTVLPGRVAPVVLEARAQAAAGAYDEAWSRFERVRSRPDVRIDAPSVLHAMAISAIRTGHFDAALDTFRALVSRVELLDDGAERARIMIEASVLMLNGGPEHLAEAIGYITEARRLPRAPGLSDYVTATLAMALDLQGLSDEAIGIAAEANGPWELESDRERGGKSPNLPVLSPGSIDALVAILAEHHDRELALERWQSYLDGSAGKSAHLASWAKQRQAALLGKARRGKAR